MGFRVKTQEDKFSSINRTIRMRAELYAQLRELADKTNVSFNKLVNQCIQYALDNMDD